MPTEQPDIPADLRACNDCGVQPGEPHAEGCDVARCLAHGTQRIQCGPGHDCGQDIWSGRWPGVAECEEFGWWTVFVPYGDPSWRPVPPGTPGAVPDLTRLVTEATWDPSAKRWRPDRAD